MFGSKFTLVPCLIVLAASLAWTSGAAAIVVASYAGPTTLDGIDDTVVLPNVSVGLEGTVSLQFKAHDTAGMHTLWYYANSPGETSGCLGEYRLNLTNDTVWSQLWPAGCSAGFGSQFHLTDTTGWHTVSLSWKNGYDVVLKLDGSESRYPIAYESGAPVSLSAFTSTTSLHVLGVCPLPSPDPPFRYFDGEIRNVVITNAYGQTPEPGTLVILATGLSSLLAYAWCRRKQYLNCEKS
jgi:hypothetical protein